MQKNNLRFRSFHTGHTFPSKYLLAAALFMVSALSFLSLMTGRYPLSFGLLLSGDTQAVQVFITLRVPRTGMALLGGFGLGIAGYVFQTIFRNPLASPDMIGVSSGASAGAAFGILFLSSGAFAGGLSVTASAFTGGCAMPSMVRAQS